jgi:hypothetical protein
MRLQEAEAANIALLNSKFGIANKKLSIANISKFTKTVDLVSVYLTESIVILFRGKDLIKPNLFNIFIYIKFAKLSYNFVVNLLELWKQEDKPQTLQKDLF